MKKCGYGCSYWDDQGDSCNCNPKPVTERTKESVGCKFHNGPDAPIEGQLEFDVPIYLLDLCRQCKNNPATSTRACGFELVPDEETGMAKGVYCTGLAHVDDLVNEHGSLCSRCRRDRVNGAQDPCDNDVDDIDGTCCGGFTIADNAWPCNVCAHDGLDAEDDGYKCDMQDDGLCVNFEEAEDINQLCKSCADWGGNHEELTRGGEFVKDLCSGKTDGSVECSDFVASDEEEKVEEPEAVEA